MKRITVDYENNAEAWWDAAQNVPIAAQPLFDGEGVDMITVTDEESAEILAWAESLPGWDNGNAPEFAPHPLIVEDA